MDENGDSSLKAMSQDINHLLNTCRWVYYLDRTQPDHENRQLYRVSIVIEDEPGHFPTGGETKEPWYWSEAVCKERNAARGFSELDVFEIVSSSMRAGRL